MDFEIASLSAIMNEFNETETSLDKLREVFSSFQCVKSPDEQDFLRYKAIDYEEHNKARTYLLLDDKGIAAYFSLAFKSIDLQNTSPDKRKRMTGGESNSCTYSAFLIGHIAKDDRVKEKLGDQIIEMANDLLLEAQEIVGGRLVYIDCKGIPELIEYYERNHFTYFNTSPSGLLQYYRKL
ncbi:MAG: hypothetical protein K2G44_05700 [Clostridia bacterium]|nr:hypothetical protein [Clostridia bacterium]